MARWIGPVVLGGLVLFALGLVAVYGLSEWRMNQEYTVTADALSLPEEPGDVTRGEHLVTAVSACMDCHGDDLGGKRVQDIPLLASVTGPNITTGEGGIADSSDQALAMNIRHGLSRDGRPLLVMPAQNFYHLSDDDLAAVIAYLREAPPVDSDLDQGNPGLMIRGPIILGMFNLLPATDIDHDGPRPEPPPEEAETAAYGEYLTSIAGCRDCHGGSMTGGRTPGMGPEANDLTMTGAAARWDVDDFMRAMREGTTPSGDQIDPIMPYRYYGEMTDLELGAIHEYLQTLPE